MLLYVVLDYFPMMALHQVLPPYTRFLILRVNRSWKLWRDLALSHCLCCCISRAPMFVSACHVWAGECFPPFCGSERKAAACMRKAQSGYSWLNLIRRDSQAGCFVYSIRVGARCCRVNTLTSIRERTQGKMRAACLATEYYYPGIYCLIYRQICLMALGFNYRKWMCKECAFYKHLQPKWSCNSVWA